MPATPKQPVRAVAYLRVSKVGPRGDELISDDLQLFEIKEYAKRNNITIVDVVQDLDKSGRNFSKRKVAKIIERVKAGEVDMVLLWKWSRWGRNTNESLTYIAQLEQAGGEVQAATEHFDRKTSYGKFTRGLFLQMAELQSDQIGDGWKETQEYRRRKKLPHTAAPRFGYRYVRPEPGEQGEQFYDVVEENADILRSAYQRFVAGTASFRSLSMEWNKAGIKTTAGTDWSDSSVRMMMDTGFAAGLIRERSEPPEPGQRNSKRIAEFDIWREGSHRAIISAELWSVYKAMRMEASQLVPALRSPKHALSGMLFCHECGQTLKTHLSGQGGKYHQWVCRNGRDRRHPPVTVSNIRAMKAVSTWLADQAVGGESVVSDAQAIVDKRGSSLRELGSLQESLSKAKRKRHRLQEQFLDDKFELDFYETKRAELDLEIDGLVAQMAKSEARDTQGQARPEVERFMELSDRWLLWEPRHQRAALAEVLSGIVAVPDRGLWFVSAWE